MLKIFFLKGMDARLRRQLSEKLKQLGYTSEENVDLSTVDETETSVWIIHESRHSEVEEKVREIEPDLVVFVSLDARMPVLYDGGKETGARKTWKVGTHQLASSVERLDDHFNSTSPSEWSCEAWQPPIASNVSALAILCQGALAAQVSNNGCTSEDTLSDVVERALEKMGWASLDPGTKNRLDLDPSGPRTSEWWLQPFDNLEGQLESFVREEMKELVDQDLEGLDDLRAVVSLAKYIEAGNVPDLNTIAKAYLALERHLAKA